MKALFYSRILVLFLLLLFVDCSRNPVTGERELMFVSRSQEIQMGREADPQIVASFGLYDDQQLQDFITAKGMEMARISHRPKLPYEFKILDSEVVNAFALPGGFVYFTRGILAHFNNEAEFAGVLGHEIGHITARHSAKQQTSQILGQIGLLAGVIASEEFRQYADVAQQGLSLLFLKFSRDHESQSDRLGVEYSTKIGYDADEMADFFNTLKRLQGDSGGVPTFLSTHPDPANREKQVAKFAHLWKGKLKKDNYVVNRASYLRMIDGMIYGADPKQGFVENWTFYHPAMRFEFPVPRGWQYQNSPIQFQMAPVDGKALIILTFGQGSTPRQAAQKYLEQNRLETIGLTDLNINGYRAVEVISQQPQNSNAGANQQSVRIASTFIKKDNRILAFHGMTYASLFNSYKPQFDKTARGFDSLTDTEKLNRKPERIRIRTVPRRASLRATLQEMQVPAERMKELAILNGMTLNDRLQKGMLIKTVGK